MNKTELINKIKKELNVNEKEANTINKIIKETFPVGRKNKEKMITRFQDELNIDSKESDKIYNKVMSIISKGIKEKIVHPFKNEKKEK